MTRRLYDEDAYCKRFTATVLSCESRDDRYALILDQTAFFPEGGGQSADSGTLNHLTVMDVQMIEETIYHFVDAPIAIGETVVGELDWPTRYLRMQKHTGEHIVSGIVFTGIIVGRRLCATAARKHE